MSICLLVSRFVLFFFQSFASCHVLSIFLCPVGSSGAKDCGLAIAAKLRVAARRRGARLRRAASAMAEARAARVTRKCDFYQGLATDVPIISSMPTT